MRRPTGNGNVPQLIPSLRDYNATKLLHDVIAGLTVGLVALPLAMAFAISSGVPPQAGLYTAVIAAFSSRLRAGRSSGNRRTDGRLCRGRLRHRGQTLALTVYASARSWPA